MTNKHTLLKHARTGDRGPPTGPELGITITPRLVAEQLGPKMSVMPNGNLFCEEVPVARTGWMYYGPNDGLPIPPNDQGFIYIERTEDQLFSPESLASLMGCAVTDDHPSGKDDWVTQANWEKLSKGFVTTNVRRGSGELADCIVADLIITNPSLIKSIRAGKREVSAGYDADYELTGAGQGRQHNLRFNHIALVEKGRCGPRCAIGDHDSFSPQLQKETSMTDRLKVRTPRARATDDDIEDLRTKADAANQALAEAEHGDEDNGMHIHIHTSDNAPTAVKKEPQASEPGAAGDRLDKLETLVVGLVKTVDTLVKSKTTDADLTPEEKALAAKKRKAKDDGMDMDDDGEGGTEDKGGRKTKDSAALETGYNDLGAKCEILVPGFKMPTFDAEAPRKITVDSMCKQRRRALDMAYMSKEGADIINSITGAQTLDLDGLDCSETAMLFNAASSARAKANNHATTDSASKLPELVGGLPVPSVTITDINARNRAFWKQTP